MGRGALRPRGTAVPWADAILPGFQVPQLCQCQFLSDNILYCVIDTVQRCEILHPSVTTYTDEVPPNWQSDNFLSIIASMISSSEITVLYSTESAPGTGSPENASGHTLVHLRRFSNHSTSRAASTLLVGHPTLYVRFELRAQVRHMEVHLADDGGCLVCGGTAVPAQAVL